jgi:hypothetical protein
MNTTTYVLEPYDVTESETRHCHRCNAQIIWLTSYKTGRHYSVDVKKVCDRLQTARNWFHSCPPAQMALPLPVVPVTPDAVYSPRKTTNCGKQEAMRFYIEQASERQLRNALEAIFQRQTFSEQEMDSTHDSNGRGFTGVDAQILSDIHKKGKLYGCLKGRQIDLVRKRMKRYSRQLVDAAEQGEWRP